jgi:hypothetical protein
MAVEAAAAGGAEGARWAGARTPAEVHEACAESIRLRAAHPFSCGPYIPEPCDDPAGFASNLEAINRRGLLTYLSQPGNRCGDRWAEYRWADLQRKDIRWHDGATIQRELVCGWIEPALGARLAARLAAVPDVAIDYDGRTAGEIVPDDPTNLDSTSLASRPENIGREALAGQQAAIRRYEFTGTASFAESKQKLEETWRALDAEGVPCIYITYGIWKQCGARRLIGEMERFHASPEAREYLDRLRPFTAIDHQWSRCGYLTGLLARALGETAAP